VENIIFAMVLSFVFFKIFVGPANITIVGHYVITPASVLFVSISFAHIPSPVKISNQYRKNLVPGHDRELVGFCR